MMVGAKVELNIDRTIPVNAEERLTISGLTCKNREGILALDNVSFTARSGEILGIAGIAGRGPREILESIAGLQRLERGTVTY